MKTRQSQNSSKRNSFEKQGQNNSQRQEIKQKQEEQKVDNSEITSQKVPHIFSRKQATILNYNVDPIICEKSMRVFVACGNFIQVFSLQTGLLSQILRYQYTPNDNQKNGKQKIQKEEIHKGKIIMIGLKQDNKNNFADTLISVCSKGIFAEWNIFQDQQSQNTNQIDILNKYQLIDKSQKLRHAQVDLVNQRIIAYEQTLRNFLIFDINNLKQQKIIPQIKEIPVYVTRMQLHNNKLIYILSKSIVTHNLEDGSEKIINRQSKLIGLTLSIDGKCLAVSDDFGKIYILYNFMSFNSKDDKIQSQLIIQSLPQWHAFSLRCLKFHDQYLVSAGVESVVVQWNLENQTKQFISRVGLGEILNLQIQGDYYSCIFSDNSFRVFRYDNNKLIIDQSHLNLKKEGALLIHQVPNQMNGENNNTIAFINDSRIQFKNAMNVGDQLGSAVLQQFDTNPRNYTASPNVCHKYQITSLSFSTDNRFMVSIENLIDKFLPTKQINICQLKIWEKSNDQKQPYKLMQIFPIYQENSEKSKLAFVSQKEFILTLNNEAQVWRLQQNNQKSSGKWQIIHEFNFRGSSSITQIQQITIGVKLRLKSFQNDIQNYQKTIVLLHKTQDQPSILSFWSQDSYQFIKAIVLNNDSKKVIFENSHRFLASLSENGSVEVWSIKGEFECHQWDLNFKSVADIQNNPVTSNQFVILMNSEDQRDQGLDSILLFQYSRPQNLVMFWKFIAKIKQISFMSMVLQSNQQSQNKKFGYLLIINQNLELQKLYFGITNLELKQIQFNRKKFIIEKKQNEIKQIQQYEFQDFKNMVHLKPSKSQIAETSYKPQVKIQNYNIDQDATGFLESIDNSREKMDNQMSIFSTFDNFINQILEKPSNSTDVIDIEREIQDYKKQIEKGKLENQKEENVSFDFDFKIEDYFKIF